MSYSNNGTLILDKDGYRNYIQRKIKRFENKIQNKKNEIKVLESKGDHIGSQIQDRLIKNDERECENLKTFLERIDQGEFNDVQSFNVDANDF